MKLGKKASNLSAPQLNKSKKRFSILFLIIITGGLIFWVLNIGKKAEATVPVVMLKNSVYKNQVITEELLVKYDMLQGEFEKYAIKDNSGVVNRRLILWEERGIILNSFAAYPLQAETVLEYRSLIQSRVDNSDSVLYNFPGKEIVQLEVGSSDLNAFKTFLRPGDRLNISAIFTEDANYYITDEEGKRQEVTAEVIRTETVFGSILIADLINSGGESILDLYENYNSLTVWEQANLDASSSWNERVTPNSLLVALTPSEKTRYYKFLSKGSVTFRVSLPQRVD